MRVVNYYFHSFSRMRSLSDFIRWAFYLCALLPLAVSAHDYSEDHENILDLIRQGGTQPEPESGPSADLLRCNKAAWRVPDQYLVVLRRDSRGPHVKRSVRRLQARAARRGSRLEVLRTFSGPFLGFAVKMSSDVLQLALTLPHVEYIEEDSFIFAQSAPWNVQRLLQPHYAILEPMRYRAHNGGGQAEVYLMDGSVHTSHRELEGRVLVTDFNSVPEEDGLRVHRQTSQCDGHGTHVAGVVSGLDSGVAPGAAISLVRVLNCQGKGSLSGALAAIEYIRAILLARHGAGPPAVVLMPFVGGLSRTLNAACRGLVGGGAVVVAPAGNLRDDACRYSPAAEPEVITVAAVTSEDEPMALGAGGTNFGRCVDLFASGDDIVSASSDCTTCFTPRSGTSQAAAHVAGVAAVMLSSSPNASAVQVLQRMLRYSVRGSINLLPVPETHRLPTPNLLAAMPPAPPSGNTGAELLCRSVWSEKSGASPAAARVSVRCRRGEEMMGCSSYAPQGGRLGETIVSTGGLAECVARSGPGGTGVHAVARCCVTDGLQCRDAECGGPRQRLTGCSSRPLAEVSPDSRPRRGGRRRCLATEGKTSKAVCCRAPDLECQLLEHVSSDDLQAEVSCPSGWTLTDCGAVSLGSALRGPVAEGNGCLVRSASGADGAGGVATCCRVRRSTEPASSGR